jgi:hypothetical protein
MIFQAGNILQSLSRLTFLRYLDLSYNNPTGSIPSESQLDTLYAANPLMYMGNLGLCGPPLTKNYSSNYKPRQLRRIQGEYTNFFYLGLGCGFIVGNWAISFTLLYKKSFTLLTYASLTSCTTKHMFLWWLLVQDWLGKLQTPSGEVSTTVPNNLWMVG